MKDRYIFLLRHCQTQLSEKKRLIGQYDVPLNEKGIALSHRIGAALKKHSFNHVFCSDLRRSVETAEIIASHLELKPKRVEGLREISLGQWDGMFIDDIQNQFPKEYEARGRDLVQYKIPQGENFIELQKRAEIAFEKILKNDGNMLIVGHSGFNKVVLCKWLRMPIDRLFTISQDYGCCNTIMEKDNHFFVQSMNQNLIDF